MLQEADFDHNQTQGFAGARAGDERLFVQFYMGTVQDFETTKEKGRPVFKDAEFIRIQQPGNLLSRIERPVRLPQDRERFPRQYQAFKAGSAEQIHGTPLSEWPLVTRAQVEEFKYYKVYTVEQLAEVADNVAQTFMGAQQLKQKAKDWLAAAGNNSELNALRDQNNELKLQVEELKSAIADLSAQMKKGK